MTVIGCIPVTGFVSFPGKRNAYFVRMFHPSSKRLQVLLTAGELQAFKLCVGVSLQSCFRTTM